MAVQEAVKQKGYKPSQVRRRLPVGAELSEGGVHFRLWAPDVKAAGVVLEGGATHALECGDGGYFQGMVPDARAGTLYRFQLDGAETLYPDPASRFQPQGVHGPSEVIDHATFQWTDSTWKGRGAEGQVIYEMHIGTFTPEGTWAAAIHKLRHLADLGVNCLEIMPVSDFAGNFGWGYDGVDFFAPTRLYGRPDDFRKFVDAAHRLNLAVILDVVYNHFGPDGNYLKDFAKDYFTDKHRNDWGESINFDGHDNGPVREFFLANTRYWIEEYHVDGFRFDATQAILDDSAEHILTAICRTARETAAAMGRKVYLVNENEPQHTCIVRPADQDGYGMDALWNDDFHHSATVAATGHNEAYYSDHLGQPQELISAAKWGYLFQGQRYSWQKKRRGTPAFDLAPTAFINFTQNHDQIANTGCGYRLHQMASPGQNRAITALLLLMPQTPMLFQGQEWGASTTFHYFADHHPKLAKMVRDGRARELKQFPSVCTPAMSSQLLDPADKSVFERSKLQWDEIGKPFHSRLLEMHRDLLKLRREDPAFRRTHRRGDLDGAVLSPEAFVLRYFGEAGDDRLVLVNLGRDLNLTPAPEPLLAPPAGMRWSVAWTSEDPKYGGCGTPAPDTEDEGWALMGRCTTFLKPLPAEKAVVKTRVLKQDDPEPRT